LRERAGRARAGRAVPLVEARVIPPRIRGRPLRPLIGRQGPFRGVRDSLDPTGRDPTLALRMRNLVIPSPETGSSVEGRPGFRPAGTASAGEVQWMGQLTLVDGSELTLRIRDGEIDEYSWTADAWTTRISQDDLTGAGITLARSEERRVGKEGRLGGGRARRRS